MRGWKMYKWGFNVGPWEFLIYWHSGTGAKGIRFIRYPREW